MKENGELDDKGIPPTKNWIMENPKKAALGGALAAGAVTVGLFAAVRYRVAGPAEYIVRTGLGISDVAINKHAIQWPFQTYTRIQMAPTTFAVEVDAMSKQRIPFKMPSVWTIGPKDDLESLKKFSRFLIDKDPTRLDETVGGIIQGEARISAANLDLDALFNDRASYKNSVTEQINAVINPFGLIVYNSNIADLKDLDSENTYFSEQKKRALQRVNQDARIHVAEAMREGETGEKKNQVEMRQQVALFEKEAKLAENQRQVEIASSNKDRVIAEAGYEQQEKIAKAEANAAAQQREWELQQKVELARSQQEVERRRATELSAASVDAEIQIRRAEGEANAIRIKAEGELFAQQRRAEGIMAIKSAEAKGLQELLKSAGNADDLAKYLLVSQNQLKDLAHEQALALQGLQPKVNIWNTGSQSEGAGKVLTDLFKTGIPLFSGIKEQTGYDFFKSAGIKSESSDASSQESNHQNEVIKRPK